jgi:arsenite methyltransferase
VQESARGGQRARPGQGEKGQTPCQEGPYGGVCGAPVTVPWIELVAKPMKFPTRVLGGTWPSAKSCSVGYGRAMSQLRFDQSMVEGLERLYATRDVLRRRALVRSALGAERGDRVLDVGCGPGFYVSELLETVGPAGSVVGVDPSPDMLSVAARRAEGHANVEFYEGAATALPIAAARFDRALSVQVLEYVDDVPAALAEIRRVLRPGGRLVIWDVDWATVSWEAFDRELMQRALEAFDRHLVHPSLPRTLSAVLRDAGFTDVQMEGHAFATNELIPDAYGGAMVAMLKRYVVDHGGMSREDAQSWADEQRELAAQEKFFFSVTQFCFSAISPT